MIRRFALIVLLWATVPAAAGQDATLLPPTPAPGARFGGAVALGDSVLAVGAPFDPVADGEGTVGPETGAVYLFRKTHAGWSPATRLTAFDAAAGDRFGAAVALNGRFLLVGAPGDDDRGSAAGAAYFYIDDGGAAWRLLRKATASDGALGDAYGQAVSLGGTFALVGAPGDDDAGSASGAAYNFSYSPNQGWVAQQKLLAPLGAAGDAFGQAIAMLGGVAVIGAPGANEPRGQGAGLAHIFTRSSLTWAAKSTLTAGDAAAGNAFGTAVALLDDGIDLWAVAGAPGNDNQGSDAGTAYAFVSQDTLWRQTFRFIPAGSTAGNRFGAAVAAGAGQVIVGAPGADVGRRDGGAAFVFNKVTPDQWAERAAFYPASAIDGDAFGAALGAQGTALAVGAPTRPMPLPEAGAAFYYADVSALQTGTAAASPSMPGLAASAYPAPFTGQVTIRVTLPAGPPAPVHLAVYDLLGRRQAVLLDAVLAGGPVSVTWDAAGRPAGMYLYRLTYGPSQMTASLLYLRP